jgi:hypothetical protein
MGTVSESHCRIKGLSGLMINADKVAAQTLAAPMTGAIAEHFAALSGSTS